MSNPGKITVVGPDGARREYLLDKATLTFGRSAENEVLLLDPLVGRRHGQFIATPSGWKVIDLSSRNGIWHREQRIAGELLLQDGDSLRVGSATIIFSAPAPSVEPQDDAPAGDATMLDAAGATMLDAISHALPQAPPLQQAPAPPAWPRLLVEGPQGRGVQELSKELISIGRGADNDIVIDHPEASRHHAQIKREGARFVLVDLGSTNGTLVNGQRAASHVLTPADVIRIGETDIRLEPPVAPPERRAEAWLADRTMMATGDAVFDAGAMPAVSLRMAKDTLMLGRHSSNDLVLPHPQVSRFHAQVRRIHGACVIFDLNSANGTFVNGQRITQHTLREGDEIRIAVHSIVFEKGAFLPSNEEGNIRLDAVDLRRVVGNDVVILNDISLTIYPREFVAVVGVSGSGKSTLMNALSGFRPATSGAVLLNNLDLYRNFDSFRSVIGYVPQDDIIHRELPVRTALDYAGQLRLPSDTTPAERAQRVQEVLGELGLMERAETLIGSLSGGQRKRVSIGVELLTRPSLFFLDEPTSGLDPSTETKMMSLLRKLADGGRTIMLITHATQNVMMCDKVVFLAKGGHLAYYGPPAESLQHFGVQNFTDIYDKLETERTPEEWAELYRRSSYFQENVQKRLEPVRASAGAAPTPVATRTAPAPPSTRISSLQQFGVLTRRAVDILVRDRMNLIILLLQAPLLAVFNLIVFKAGIFNPDPRKGDPKLVITVLFLLACGAIFLGATNGVKEIVKEKAIYKRERMVNLRIVPYILSKVTIFAVIALIQTALMIFGLAIGRLLPGSAVVGNAPLMYLELFVSLFLVLAGGLMLGLLISALVATQDAATASVVLLLMPQFMFSGALVPTSYMGAIARPLSYLMSAKWGFEVFGKICGIPQLFSKMTDQGNALLPTLSEGSKDWLMVKTRLGTIDSLSRDFQGSFDIRLGLHWMVLLAFDIVFAVVIYVALKRKDRMA